MDTECTILIKGKPEIKVNCHGRFPTIWIDKATLMFEKFEYMVNFSNWLNQAIEEKLSAENQESLNLSVTPEERNVILEGIQPW